MPDQRATETTMQAEERHEVDGRKRDRRDAVDVRPVRWVEFERPHRVGKERRMQRVRASVTVLAVLDLDQRRLLRAVEPRYRPDVRVGLLELIRRSMHRVFPHLVARAARFQPARERRAILRRDRLKLFDDTTRRDIDPPYRRA